jgi:hypothetical protein
VTLRSDPTDENSLVLLASIKARQSWLLGAWWRFSAWLGGQGDGRTVLVLLGAYLAQRTATIFARTNGHSMTADLIGYAWLALCVYSWVGPGLFRKAIDRELEKVELEAGF